MCNIAGYVGSKRAAPILIDMIKKQEGLNGGFYTGIATVDNGRLYYAKLTGDTDRLLALTNAADLPGSVGIIHSRTRSGGGDEWAHPFLDGQERFAYVANGSAGAFSGRNDAYIALARQLLEEGYQMSSRVKTENRDYQNLGDGTAVHMSDTMCQLIAKHYDAVNSEVCAMSDAFCQMPGEIVGLLLSIASPDRIFYSRINMPMFVSFCDHGAYLASSPTCFNPDHKTAPYALPACSSGWISCREYHTQDYKDPPVSIEPITEQLEENAYQAAIEALRQEEYSFSNLRHRILEPLFQSKVCIPSGLLCYKILYRLQQEKLLQIRSIYVDDVLGGKTAQYMLSVKSNCTLQTAAIPG